MNNKISEERNFNPASFAHLFTKVRTIGFSAKMIDDKDFILYREELIKEVNLYNKDLALDFAKILSSQNINYYKKEIYDLIYTCFSHFVEIYNNLHQYKDATIKTNIRIARTYLEDIKKKLNENSFATSLENIINFLELFLEKFKDQLVNISI